MVTTKQMGGLGCACHDIGVVVVQCLIDCLQFREVLELPAGDG